MVSTVRFRSFKTIDLQARRPFRADLLRRPAHRHRHAPAERARGDLVRLPVSPLIEMIVMRLRRKPAAPPAG
jgi:hypothetical protein